MIKIMRAFNTGKREEVEREEWDFEQYENYKEVLKKMKSNNCHTLLVSLEEGLQVMFTIPEKTP